MTPALDARHFESVVQRVVHLHPAGPSYPAGQCTFPPASLALLRGDEALGQGRPLVTAGFAGRRSRSFSAAWPTVASRGLAASSGPPRRSRRGGPRAEARSRPVRHALLDDPDLWPIAPRLGLRTLGTAPPSRPPQVARFGPADGAPPAGQRGFDIARWLPGRRRPTSPSTSRLDPAGPISADGVRPQAPGRRAARSLGGARSCLYPLAVVSETDHGERTSGFDGAQAPPHHPPSPSGALASWKLAAASNCAELVARAAADGAGPSWCPNARRQLVLGGRTQADERAGRAAAG